MKNTVPPDGTGTKPADEVTGSIDKALDVLFALHHRDQACGVTELARHLELPKSTTHRLLTTLSRRSLVERDGRGRYRLGFGLVALGLGALEQEPLVHAAREPLAAEAARLGETVFLVASRGGALRVLERAEGTGVLRASPRIGSTVPAHATAVGKVYFAWAPGAVPVPDEPLERFTQRTVRSLAALRRTLPAVRERGFAVSNEEWIEGLAVVAAPVQAHAGLLGTIAIATAAPRLQALGAEALGDRAIAVARAVEARLRGDTR
ncbi:MAG: IclR family transcriptional regulator [Polyangiaceae bacterium]|nr:IclR family transcriptional regulator [Polyangiaceae bacterium]